MARGTRQSKILEIISSKEIETQDDLVTELRNLGFDITQATISRDIKELGLIKVLTDSKKYKYALVDSKDQQISDKFSSMLKQGVISVKLAQNLVVIKTVKGFAAAISTFMDKIGLEYSMGCVYGDDTVMVITLSNQEALLTYEQVKKSLN